MRKRYGDHPPQPIYPGIPWNSRRTLELFWRPTFVFFHPQLQIDSVLRCPECDNVMVPNSQRSWSTDVRRIFDVDRVLLLNSYWYECENGHEGLSGFAKLDPPKSSFFRHFSPNHHHPHLVKLPPTVPSRRQPGPSAKTQYKHGAAAFLKLD